MNDFYIELEKVAFEMYSSILLSFIVATRFSLSKPLNDMPMTPLEQALKLGKVFNSKTLETPRW